MYTASFSPIHNKSKLICSRTVANACPYNLYVRHRLSLRRFFVCQPSHPTSSGAHPLGEPLVCATPLISAPIFINHKTINNQTKKHPHPSCKSLSSERLLQKQKGPVSIKGDGSLLFFFGKALEDGRGLEREGTSLEKSLPSPRPFYPLNTPHGDRGDAKGACG